MFRKLKQGIVGESRGFGFYLKVADQARDALEWEKAAENYGLALELNPARTAIWVQYGHALKESGNNLEAEQAYRKALELEPLNADTHLQLGHLLKRIGRIAEASSLYLKSHGLDPNSPHAHTELVALGWSGDDIRQGVTYLTEDQNSLDNEEDTTSLEPRIQWVPAIDEARYLRENPDIGGLVSLGLIESGEQFNRLYGYSEGRDIIRSLAENKPSRAFILCPSFHKRCGIGEHARYIKISLEKSGIEVIPIRSTDEIERFDPETLRHSILIVNHGPGLFDGYNPELSEAESTTALAVQLRTAFDRWQVRPIIFMHSLLDRDNTVMYGKQEFLLNFPIPVITTIESASRHFRIPQIEHGVQPIDVPQQTASSTKDRDYPTIGFFGFFQWGGKDFDALVNVARSLKAKLVGSVATSSQYDIDKLHEVLTQAGIKCDIGTGWVTDEELARRLSEADFFYLPQKDYDHWNNSGTARFVMNLGKPVLLPPFQPFLDLRHVAIFAEEHELPRVVAYLRDEQRYKKACQRVEAYRTTTGMEKTMLDIVWRLPETVNQFTRESFVNPSTFSLQQLLSISPPHAANRLQQAGIKPRLVSEDLWPEQLMQHYQESAASLPVRFQIPAEIQIWKRHYQLSELWFFNVDDFIHNGYRTLAKREPSFFEYRNARSELPDVAELNRPTLMDIKTIIGYLGKLARHQQKDDMYGPPEISLRDRRIGYDELLNPSEYLLERIMDQIVMPMMAARDIPQTNSKSGIPTDDCNLFTILAMKPSWLSHNLHTASEGKIDLKHCELISTQPSLRLRYLLASEAYARFGLKITDRFIIDEPIVNPINYRRQAYCMGELLLLEGDAFTINLVRCLAKRNPFALEMFQLGAVIGEKGKVEAIRQYTNRQSLNGYIVDLHDNHHDFAPDSQEAKELQRLFHDFRSVTAGGWDRRNAYLETKRNFGRFWLNSKMVRDIWWAQSGGDMQALSN